jgi:ABC-2 type transport system ATP-binding protein
MDEAQNLADRVAVISKGEIVAEGPPATLGDRHLADAAIRFRLPAAAELPPELAALAIATEEGYELIVPDATRALNDLTGWALEHGMELEGLHVAQPTLEDVYLELTGGEAGQE